MTNYNLNIGMSDDPCLEDLKTLPIYSEQELEMSPAIEEKIENLIKFFDQSDFLSSIDLNEKKAYPNYDQYMHIPGQHDLQKWIQTLKTVKYLESHGHERAQAIRQSTSGWHILETFDFLNWLKFYGTGDHMKYKFAQLWYENGAPGYFLQVKPDQPKKTDHNNIDFSQPTANHIDDEKSEKQNIIEKQRSKITGRLDSIEKLLRSSDGHMFAGREFEALIDAIYDLKKKIHLVNKVSSSIKLYEDMIIRQANVLLKQGFNKAGEMLYNIAQANNPPPPNTGTQGPINALTPSVPPPPTQGQGNAGGVPSTGPGAPTMPPDMPNDNSPVGEFLNKLETGNVTTEDSLSSDTLEIDDFIDVSDVDDMLLITEAQAAVPPPPSTTLPPTSPNMNTPSLEVSENEAETKDESKDESELPSKNVRNFDSQVNELFSHITVSDVVMKLEDLAKVFKVREIPRQLGMVDMMLDSLGIASYFPSLSEATNKALESNNYISTRVEDILSKLRGAMSTNEIDLQGDDQKDISPEVSNIKNKLQNDSDTEKARKKMRKDQENIDLVNKNTTDKETPDVEIEEDLGSAPSAESVPAAPVKPAAPLVPKTNP